jgi:hypothetical protein
MSEKALADLYDKVEGLKASGQFNKLNDSALASLYDEFEKANAMPDKEMGTDQSAKSAILANVSSTKPKKQEFVTDLTNVNKQPLQNKSEYQFQDLAQQQRDVEAAKIMNKEPGIREKLLGREVSADIAKEPSMFGKVVKGAMGAMSYAYRFASANNPLTIINERITGEKPTSIADADIIKKPMNMFNKTIDSWVYKNPSKKEAIDSLENAQREIINNNDLSASQKAKAQKIINNALNKAEEGSSPVFIRVAANALKIAGTLTAYAITDPLSYFSKIIPKTDVATDIAKIAKPEAEIGDYIGRLKAIKESKLSLPQKIELELAKVKTGATAESKTAIMNLGEAKAMLAKVNPKRIEGGLSKGVIKQVSDKEFIVEFPATTKQLPEAQKGVLTSMEPKFGPLDETQKQARLTNADRVKKGLPQVLVETDPKAPIESNSWIRDPLIQKPIGSVSVEGAGKSIPIQKLYKKTEPGTLDANIPEKVGFNTSEPIMESKAKAESFGDIVTSPVETPIMESTGTVNIPKETLKENVITPTYKPGGSVTIESTIDLPEQTAKLQKALSTDLMNDYAKSRLQEEYGQYAKQTEQQLGSELEKSIKKSDSYTSGEIEDLASIDWKKAQQTGARELNSDYSFSTSDKSLTARVADLLSTARGDKLALANKSLSGDPRFTSLLKIESKVPMDFKRFEPTGSSQLNQNIDFMFKSLPDASPKQVDGIIERILPPGSQVLLDEIKQGLSSIFNKKITTADQLRDIEQKLNAMRLPTEKIGTIAERQFDNILKHLKEYITTNREQQVTGFVEQGATGAGKAYLDLSIEAANTLHEQSGFLNDLGIKNFHDLNNAEKINLRKALAEKFKIITDDLAKGGLKSDAKTISNLEEMGNRIGIPDLVEQLKEIATIKNTRALENVSKGTKVLPGEIMPVNRNEKSGLLKIVSKSFPNWKIRSTSRIADAIVNDFNTVEIKKILENASKLANKSKSNTKSQILNAFIDLKTPAQLSAYFSNKVRVQDLKDLYSDDPERLNKIEQIKEKSISSEAP